MNNRPPRRRPSAAPRRRTTRNTRRRRRSNARFFLPGVIIAIAIFVWLGGNLLDFWSTPDAPENFTEAFVVRVVDGDTIVIDTGERVRFIGIDAPEIGQPGADEATEFVHDRIYHRTIWMEACYPDADRFGRLRRYIWLQLPQDPQCPEERSRYQLNTMLVENGLAEVFIVGG